MRDAKAPRNARPRRRVSFRAPLVGAALTVFALLGVGGTYAFLVDVAEVPGATVRAGSLDVLIDGQKAVAWSGAGWALAPNAPVAREFTVSNVGDAPSTVTAAFASTGALAGHARVRIAPLTGSATCTAATVGGIEGPITAFPNTGDNLAPNATARYCLVVSLVDAPIALAGQSLGFTLTVTATQRVA